MAFTQHLVIRVDHPCLRLSCHVQTACQKRGFAHLACTFHKNSPLSASQRRLQPPVHRSFDVERRGLRHGPRGGLQHIRIDGHLRSMYTGDQALDQGGIVQRAAPEQILDRFQDRLLPVAQLPLIVLAYG